MRRRAVLLPGIALQSFRYAGSDIRRCAIAVCDGNETRVSDVRKNQVAEMRAPNAIKDLSIRLDRCGRHVIPTKSRLAMHKVRIEDVTAQSSARRAAQVVNKPVVGELFFDGDCAQADLMFDCF